MSVLTVAETALQLKVSKGTIYSMIYEGKLPHIKVGRSYRIIEDQLFDWIKDGMKGNANGFNNN